jgi:ATP-dependent Clp protease, protease subunit
MENTLFQGNSIRNVALDGVTDSSRPAYHSIREAAPVAVNLPATSSENSTTLKDNGVFFISGGFNSVLARDVVTWILESNFNKERKFDHLTLLINSPGGELPSAFAIIDAMKGSSLPVHTIGLGQISSCGFLTFIAGEKGKRILTPNTSILSHQYSWGSMGKEHELLATVKEFNLTTERLVNHYMAHTTLDKDTIREKLLPPHDVWLSAQEALDLGICDEIKVMGA